MSAAWLLAAQTLTNLGFAPPGAGLPPGWRLEPAPRVSTAHFSVTAGHALRVTTQRAAGFASSRLRPPLGPGRGVLTWQWRTETAVHGAVLRERARADSPVRVLVGFDDGRMLYYSWGNREPVGDSFASPSGRSRGVLVCRRAQDADGSWHVERRDPFADYRRVFNRAPHAIVAIGIGADSDMLGGRTVAEVGEVTWEEGGTP